MLKKVVKYEDLNGDMQTEEVYFNISQNELLNGQFSKSGGIIRGLKSIVDTKDYGAAFDVIRKYILNAYGVKSEDGKRFVKDPEKTKEFEQSVAFDQIFMELVNDADAAIDFIVGVLPKSVQDQVNVRLKNSDVLTKLQPQLESKSGGANAET